MVALVTLGWIVEITGPSLFEEDLNLRHTAIDKQFDTVDETTVV
jgi:hypothetical protein